MDKAKPKPIALTVQVNTANLKPPPLSPMCGWQKSDPESDASPYNTPTKKHTTQHHHRTRASNELPPLVGICTLVSIARKLTIDTKRWLL